MQKIMLTSLELSLHCVGWNLQNAGTLYFYFVPVKVWNNYSRLRPAPLFDRFFSLCQPIGRIFALGCDYGAQAEFLINIFFFIMRAKNETLCCNKVGKVDKKISRGHIFIHRSINPFSSRRSEWLSFCRSRFEPPLEETQHESTTEIEAQHGGRSVFSHFLSGKLNLEQL